MNDVELSHCVEAVVRDAWGILGFGRIPDYEIDRLDALDVYEAMYDGVCAGIDTLFSVNTEHVFGLLPKSRLLIPRNEAAKVIKAEIDKELVVKPINPFVRNHGINDLRLKLTLVTTIFDTLASLPVHAVRPDLNVAGCRVQRQGSQLMLTPNCL